MMHCNYSDIRAGLSIEDSSEYAQPKANCSTVMESKPHFWTTQS